jgi:hypothetical protein
MKTNAFISGAGALLALCTMFACNKQSDTSPAKLDESTKYAGAYRPPHVRSYPAKAAEINKWIYEMDNKKIRQHAWDIWESINTTAADSMPIWENWFSGYELYEAPTSLEERETIRDFEFPSQFFHASMIKQTIPEAPSERPTSFNRFSPSLAQFIFQKQYNDSAVLNKINSQFNTSHTAPVDRQIETSKDSFDVHSFALKPVFQFISGSQAVAVPYWAGVSPQSTTLLTNPSPDTWRQCVVVDPTGTLQPGTTALMSCNGETPKQWPVVSLNNFYHILITQSQADSFSTFAATSGDDVGRNNHSDSASVTDMVKPGNYALLVAMHVTGKEVSNWTWQTFWWSPDTDNPEFGADRPKTIKAPWNNYNMRTAYYMVAPPGTKHAGEPLISFNPYLETNLIGTLTHEVESKDTITWYGVFSNCMSCHRMAAWGPSTYISDGFIDPSSPVLFSNNTKTDFLWSIPTRAQ